MSAQTSERRQTSHGPGVGWELHHYPKAGFGEEVPEGQPFTYYDLCGEVWTSEPGNLGLLPTKAGREHPRAHDERARLYEQLVNSTGER